MPIFGQLSDGVPIFVARNDLKSCLFGVEISVIEGYIAPFNFEHF